MKAKNIIILIIVLALIVLALYFFKAENKTITNTQIVKTFAEKTPAQLFKEVYEGDYKGKKGNQLRSVNIDENNPFYEVTIDEIVDMINSNKSFYVYFGDERCPWCRSTIEECIKVAKENNISRIYYVQIWENEFDEVFRDTYTLEDGIPTIEKEGTESYKKLLELFDSVLENYTLKNDSGEEIEVGEKRIYAPTFVYIENGIVKRGTDGTSDLQEEADQEITTEIIQDQNRIYSEFFKAENCGEEGC